MKYLLLTFIIVFSSCGSSTKKVQKTTTTTNIDQMTTDKSQIEIYRELDSTVYVKYESASVKLTSSDLINTPDSIVTKSLKKGNLTITASYNKNTKEFSADAVKDSEAIPIKIHEVVKQNNNITTNTKQASEVKTIDKDKTFQTAFNWNKICIWMGIIAGFVILIIALIKLPNLNKK